MSENETPVSPGREREAPESVTPVSVDPESVDDDATTQQLSLPPASFEYLVETLRFQAEMQLGLLDFDEEVDEKDRPEPNLDLARHLIDTLAMLQEKTRGNLSLEEKRQLENTVTELRFRFVQTAGKSAKA